MTPNYNSCQVNSAKNLWGDIPKRPQYALHLDH